MRNYLAGYGIILNVDTSAVSAVSPFGCQQYVRHRSWYRYSRYPTSVVSFCLSSVTALFPAAPGDDPDGGGIASVDVVDQESKEAHHVQGRWATISTIGYSSCSQWTLRRQHEVKIGSIVSRVPQM